MSKLTRRDMYNILYTEKKASCLKDGLSEDKSSRYANIFAVKNTERYWLLNNSGGNK